MFTGSDPWQKRAGGVGRGPGAGLQSPDEGKGTDRRELAAALHRRAPGPIRRAHPADQLRRLPGPLRAPGRGAERRRRPPDAQRHRRRRSEEHTYEIPSLMRISYAVVCLKKKNEKKTTKL